MQRHRWVGPAAVALVALTIVTSCASPQVTVPAAQAPGRLPPELAPFAAPGAHSVTVTPGQVRSEFGCTVKYEVHEPAGRPGSEEGGPEAAAPATVILAHGFMRSLAAMRGWATHWASHGVRTVVVSFCNSSWFAGRHDRNARDMVAVASAVPAGAPGSGVIYAGFSAGGLAALLAAADDSRAVAFLGLDAVDSGDLAATASGRIPRALFLFGEPSSCNADGNVVPLLPQFPGATALRIPFATHCDFENPYDPACERICGSVGPETTALAVRETIMAVATAWIVTRAGGAEAPEGELVQQLERERRAVRLQ